MANLAELFHKESRLLSNVSMQRDLLMVLRTETDENSKAMVEKLLNTLLEEEKTLRGA
ncbi:MAG: hypothetical protein LBN43_08865 [Oscillospiraceae bacterium]|jgi:hypothetical protein|nr:hypothetical protein [Oscillospiraceae bacterium]